MVPRFRGHPDQPVVAGCLSAFRLLGFYYAEQTRSHQAAGKCRFIHEEKYVQRIAIRAESPRNKPKVEGEVGPGREYVREHEESLLLAILELVAAALRRFDD